MIEKTFPSVPISLPFVDGLLSGGPMDGKPSAM